MKRSILGLDWNSVGRDCPLLPLVVSVKSEIIIGIDNIYVPRIRERRQFKQVDLAKSLKHR